MFGIVCDSSRSYYGCQLLLSAFRKDPAGDLATFVFQARVPFRTDMLQNCRIGRIIGKDGQCFLRIVYDQGPAVQTSGRNGRQPLALQCCGHSPGNKRFYLIGGQERRVFKIRNDSAGRVAFIKDEPRAETLQSLQADQSVEIPYSIVVHNFNYDTFFATSATQGDTICNLVQLTGLLVRVVNYAF